MTTTQQRPLIGLSLLILLGFIWGTGYSIARFAMTNGVPPLGYSFWQSLGPAMVLGLISSCKSKHLPLTTTHLQYFFICGLTGIVIPNTAMYVAAPHLPAGILAVIVNIVPILAYPLALMAKLEQFSWQRVLGIGLAFTGLMCIILPKTSLPSPTMVPWVIATLITPVSFAICSIYIARFRPPDTDSLTLSAGMLLVSSLILMPLVLWQHSFYAIHWPFSIADWIVLLEIFLSSIGYILFFQLIKLAGPVYYSLVDTMVVLTGLFWSRVIFDERLNHWTAIAVCLIVIALLLVTQQQRHNTKVLQSDHA